MTDSVACTNSILALDFDGVIADSIEECLVSGHNAFAEFSHQPHLIHRLDGIDPMVVSESKRIRRYIRTGEDYVFIFMALHQKHAIDSQQQFDAFKDENKSIIPCFHELFYGQRRRFSQEDVQAWASLNPLYPGIKTFLQDHDQNSDLYIITSKQTEYAHLILEAHHIHLDRTNSFQAAGSLTKGELIKRILQDRDLSAGQCHFIDDQVDTLLKVQQLGIHCYLAVWGYNDDEQAELAAQNGIEMLTLENFLLRFQYPLQDSSME